MNSFEFADKLSNFPEIRKHFQGVFSADNLPQKIKNNSSVFGVALPSHLILEDRKVIFIFKLV